MADPPMNRQTQLKSLPSRNFVGGRKQFTQQENVKSIH